jgi:ribonucleoside-diphosphate reductase alpha chain
MTGMMDNPAIAFDVALQRNMARLILEVNADIAARIGIAPAARATCVKPAGTSSCVLGTSSGIHPHHAQRYFRRVQANISEPSLSRFRELNPAAVEPSVWNPNGTDQIITFCIEAPENALTRDRLDATRLLEYVKLTQENWVDAGRRPERCAKEWLRHNVSNTISVRADEWEAVTDFIYANRHAFAGVSLLPYGGDLDYPQAPFCAVWTAEEIAVEYGPGAIMASGLIVDGLHAYSGNLWAACACALGIGERLEPPVHPGDSAEELARYQDHVKSWLGKKDWVRRAAKFAKNYFSGDIREMTHCLKRVHNCKLWEDLTRAYRAVDYRAVSGEAPIEETAACAGGSCEII